MPLAVIMAGGQGERFWPLTHPLFPKYRLRFEGKTSLLQKTYQRLSKIYPASHIYVVTTHEHSNMIRRELPKLGKSKILIEPFRRNTAAAIFFATSYLMKVAGEHEVISFFPADHLIQDENLFKKTLKSAIALAEAGEFLVTVGIRPTFPATGFGYIESGKSIRGQKDCYEVARFVEKPNRKKAEAYLRRKNFYWNGGIFTWRIEVLMEAIRMHAPALHRGLNLNHLAESYRKLPNVSIDVALLEKAKNIALCQTQMDWCDLGSWDMLYSKSRPDVDGNYKEGVVVARECSNSLFINHVKKPLMVLGAKRQVIVQTEQGTLVCPLGRSEQGALLAKGK